MKQPKSAKNNHFPPETISPGRGPTPPPEKTIKINQKQSLFHQKPSPRGEALPYRCRKQSKSAKNNLPRRRPYLAAAENNQNQPKTITFPPAIISQGEAISPRRRKQSKSTKNNHFSTKNNLPRGRPYPPAAENNQNQPKTTIFPPRTISPREDPRPLLQKTIKINQKKTNPPKAICPGGGPTPPQKKTIKINTKQLLSTKNNIPRAKQHWHAQRKHRLWNRDLNPPNIFHGATAKRRYSMESKIMSFCLVLCH